MHQNSILGYFPKSRSPRPDNSRPGQPYRQNAHSNPPSHNSNGRRGNHQYRGRSRHGNAALKMVADETKAELAELLVDIPDFDAMDSSLHHLGDLKPLDPNDCPNFLLPDGDADAGKAGTRIRVLNMDSFDLALQLDLEYNVQTHLAISLSTASPNDTQNSNMQSQYGMASSYFSYRDAGSSSRVEERSRNNDEMMIDAEDSNPGDEIDPEDVTEIEEETAAIHLDHNANKNSKAPADNLADDRDCDESSRQRASIPSSTKNNLVPSVSTKPPNRKPVAVLNLASERSPGGGWQNGALAQEECLCYRSSLYLSLHRSFYPLRSLSAIHTPNVVLIRDAMSRGHTLLTNTEPPENLPVTSVISVAALRRPELSDDRKTFRNAGQRSETKRKIRLTLRLAALKGHTRLVLGALGCGVFANPPKEVAECFLEVLREKEFQGGWWEMVAFAVLDNVKGPDGGKDGKGNFGIFYRVLDGQAV